MRPLRKPALSSPVAFRVPTQYVVQEFLGEGAYGVVCSALHTPSGQKVAIKKVVPFEHTLTCLRTLRELKLLRHFQHENIISILDVPKPLSYHGFNEVYLVQELMPTDLHKVIRSQDLSDAHCQYFTYQLLRGIKAMHSAGVLHRDLKPANLLVNDRCDLKICDFGLARADVNREDQHSFMTENVATLWYRAPEVMITFKEYTRAIDMWSVGCILAEMLGGGVLLPGKDYHDQLTLIFGTLGSPSMEDYQAIRSRRARAYIMSLPVQRRVSWKSILPNATDLSLDLLNRLLAFNPGKRITVEEALKHPYVEAYHDPDDEPISEIVPYEVFSLEKKDQPLNREELKRMCLPSFTCGEVSADRAHRSCVSRSYAGTTSPPGPECGWSCYLSSLGQPSRRTWCRKQGRLRPRVIGTWTASHHFRPWLGIFWTLGGKDKPADRLSPTCTNIVNALS